MLRLPLPPILLLLFLLLISFCASFSFLPLRLISFFSTQNLGTYACLYRISSTPSAVYTVYILDIYISYSNRSHARFRNFLLAFTFSNATKESFPMHTQTFPYFTLYVYTAIYIHIYIYIESYVKVNIMCILWKISMIFRARIARYFSLGLLVKN